jgi:PIN domain nuclease of toxin-antitoxin system
MGRRRLRYLLDTHTLLWAANAPQKLSPAIAKLLQDGTLRIFVSAVSAWEIATKVRVGKLANTPSLLEDFEAKLSEQGFVGLPITIAQAVLAGTFPHPHKDPFDRILAAQALTEQMTLLSADTQLDVFGVQRRW